MITPQQLQDVASSINNQAISEILIAELRERFPAVHFTYCMEDDIPNHKPVLEAPGYNLYLVDGREHCLCLTQNFEHASGIVVAEVLADED